MTKFEAVKVDGKHAVVLHALAWDGAALCVAALIYCLNGGDVWFVLGAALIGLGLTGGGVVWASKGSAADLAHAGRRSFSGAGLSSVPPSAPKPPVLAQT